ncbi:hypothetical protein A4A49_31445 [Nicotiana attenuata]|uniref:Uncharacterized protein n=1 Tax=Nicotiana attenuata TaxID=49451 RepID=A0A314KQX8_NICAT|nr:hypothetical protein A4A49_31445 [Nicotiana attenuata]
MVKSSGTVPSPKLKDQDGYGFRTPTSLEYKIPERKKCPLPPKKTRPTSTKRKATVSPKIQRILLVDFESIFTTTIQDHLDFKSRDREKWITNAEF